MTYESTLDALGDGTRRALVDLLGAHPRTVGELASLLPVSQPAVSQHLKVLREAGLVAVDPQGRRRIYRLRREGFVALRVWVDSFWDGALEAFRASFDDAPGGDEREG